MRTLNIIAIVILVILIIIIIGLIIYGKWAEKKQAKQKEEMAAMAQTVPMLIIDKKRMKLKESGLPTSVIESVPRIGRGSKVPIVKAKVGPKIVNLTCDPELFAQIPVKKEVKAVVSGIYISSVRGIRGPLETPVKKKRGLFSRFRNK